MHRNGRRRRIGVCSVIKGYFWLIEETLKKRMEDNFASLHSQIDVLKCDFKQEIEGVKTTVKKIEKAWAAIDDLKNQKVTKTLNDHTKKCLIIRKRSLSVSSQS